MRLRLQLLMLVQLLLLLAAGADAWRFLAPLSDVNSDSSTTVSISEATAADTSVYTVRSDTACTFTLTNAGSTCPATDFYIDGTTTTTVELRLKRQLDYETDKFHVCEVRCDAGPTRTATVTVSLTNVYDEDPTTTATTVSASVVEESAAGTVVSTVSFSDTEVLNGPADDVLTCSLSGSGSTYFYVESIRVTTPTASAGCTCRLRVLSPIDRDVLTSDAFPNIVVTATDKGGNTATATFSVTVTDINDNDPVCSSSLTATVSEAETVPKVLTTVTCTDKDKGVNGQLEYAAAATGNPAGYTVTAAGEVSLTVAKDYDTITTNPELVRIVVNDKDATPANRRTTTATLSVYITGVNDNTPAITVTATTVTVPESATIGYPLFNPSVTDGDKAGEGDSTITWSIVSAGSTAGTDLKSVVSSFAIDTTSGAVTIGTDGLNYESWTAATIVIQAKDAGTSPSAKSVTQSLTVSVTDVNEMGPTFTPSNFVKVNVAENNIENYTVYTLNVEDPDASKTVVACEIISGNTDSVFRFNGTNKHMLELAKTIEPDSPTNHPLVFTLGILCKDNNGTSPYKSSTATVEVDLTTSNDLNPVINGVSGCPTSSRCSETTTLAGATMATLTVYDNDVGADGDFDCTILSPAGAPFSLQGCSAITLSGPLDYETATNYAVVVQAKDRGSPPRVASTTVNIYVKDEDDNAPYCTKYDYSFTVNENAAGGDDVGTVNFLDADNAGFSYSLVPATVPFTVTKVGNSARIKVKSPSTLDFESVTEYTFTVRTTDSGALSRTTDAVVRVTINPINEQTPTFANTVISVPENTAVGTIVTRFAAADSDTGGHGIVSYSMPSATNLGGNFFSVANNGDVTLTKALDYESTQSYVLTISAVDGGGLTGSGLLTVNVADRNDNSPVCDNVQVTNSMAESAASGIAATGTKPTATDADSTTLYGAIRYSIAGGDTSNFFTIDATTAEIRRSATGGLNYEALTPPNTFYNLTIHAIDENGVGPNTATCLVKMEITDSEEGSPQFSPAIATATALPESTAVGTAVYTPTWSHVDTWDSPVFTLNPTSSLFSVNAATGAIQLAAALDYETATQHTLNIVATDKNGNSNTMVLTVPVTNVNEFSPLCTPGDTTVYIDENDQESPSFPKNVMTFSCSDGDAGTTLDYAIVKVDGVAGTGAYDFTANTLRTTAALNYEPSNTEDVLEVTVSDQGPGTANILTVTVTVSLNPVNEYAPVFTAASLTPSAVNEDISVGSNVGQLQATDTDTGSDHGTIKFSLIAGNDKGFFVLNENTGWVTSAKTLDREDSATYFLTVTATDGPGRSTTATMTVSLNDVNDNSPVFTKTVYTVDVNENAVDTSTILSFTGLVSDSDATSPNNAIVLSLVTTSVPFQFAAGAPMDLRKQGTLNANTNPSYSLTVRATDNNGVASGTTRTTDVMVIVNVHPVNLVAPTFSGSSTVNIAENTAVGTLVATVNATDSDSGLAGTITYAFVGGNTNGDYIINANDGKVTLKNALDFDAGTKVYYLAIRASDSGTPVKSTTWTLTAVVTDINDNAPIWATSNSYTLAVTEDTAGPLPKTVYSPTVTDPDTGANGNVQFSLLSQSGTAPDGSSPLFAVDATSGSIRLLQQPDREFRESYILMVRACDSATTPLCSQKMFSITISDANDNTPSFGLCPKEISVAEGTLANVLIATLPATDADKDANGQVILYSLASADGGASSPANLFDVSSSGGVTTHSAVTAASLDRENKGVYQFVLTAEDNGTPSKRTGSCLLNITITDKNDNDPVIAGQPIITSVSEDAAGGTIFYTMSVTDADIGVNAALTYEISAFTPANNFTVNNNGQLSLFTHHRLDRELHAAYNITVKVRDQGTDPGQRTATATVSVNIIDVNDNTPAFSGSSITRSVAENSVVDAAIGAPVVATDPDLGASASLTYQVVAVLVPTSGGDFFKVDPLTGQLRVKVAALDRETRDTYLIRLIAADNGSPTALTGTTTVTILITDENDNSPVFGSIGGVSVDENSVAGTQVFTFTATDADTGVNSDLLFALNTTALDGPQVDTYFQLNSGTGQLTVKSPINRETPISTLTFYVTAEDKGSPVRTATATVTLTVNDVNDITPVFSPAFYNTEMYFQETRTSHVLTTVSATDGDATNNAVQYSWGSSSANFVLNPITGVVTPASGQSTAKDTLYLHYVTATDAGTPQRTATATVRIDTFNMNEVGVCVTYTAIYSTFLVNLAKIEASLESTLHFKYPTVRCETLSYAAGSSSTVRACHYCVQDNSTDSVTAVAAPKAFVSKSDLLVFWRLNTEGGPTAMLQSTNFSANPVSKVEGYSDTTTTTTTETPWYQTPWGIAVLATASVLAAALACAGIGLLIHFLKNSSPSVPIAKAPPPRAPAPKQHPQPLRQQRPNNRLNVYRDPKLHRGTPEFGRGYQRSPGETQRTGHSPTNGRLPTAVS